MEPTFWDKAKDQIATLWGSIKAQVIAKASDLRSRVIDAIDAINKPEVMPEIVSDKKETRVTSTSLAQTTPATPSHDITRRPSSPSLTKGKAETETIDESHASTTPSPSQ